VPGEAGDTVFLRAPGITAGRVVHLHTTPVARDGERIWSAEAWYTMNAKPTAEAPAVAADLLAARTEGAPR
jgi:hypothetical protein